MLSGVYKITNPVGAIYVGSSLNIKRRWSLYKCPTGTKNQNKLKNSLTKYGYNNHVFEVLEFCDVKIIRKRERELGLDLDCLNRANLNLTLPSYREKVQIWSVEKREKQSLILTGRKMPPHIPALVSKRFKGKKQSLEHIKKRIRRGSKNPMFGVKGEKHHNFGRTFIVSKETRKKRSKRMMNGGNIKAQKVINTKTMEIFSCIKEASYTVSLNYRALVSQISGHNKNRTPFVLYKKEA